MTAPSRRHVEAQQLTHGFLAARVQQALERRLEGLQPTAEDEQVLADAQAFLQRLADGESLVETGSLRGQYSRDSMNTLRMLSNPLQAIARLGKHPNLATYLGHMSDTLRPEKLRSNQVDRADLESVHQFFKIVYNAVRDAASRNRVRIRKRISRAAIP